MSQNLTWPSLEEKVSDGSIDTVLVCLVDMQGRLMGKRYLAQNFVQHSHTEVHCCNYLVATDLEMATPDGYAATSWEQGYSDYVMLPDLDTLRIVPWLAKTAMVLCELVHHGDEQKPVAHSPRQILRDQIKRLNRVSYTSKFATELEFFLFEKSYREISRDKFCNLTPMSDYNEDYNIFQTTKQEAIMRPLRNHLHAMGIPIECSKGEAEAGQLELNIRYAEALACADHHILAKHATKEIAWQNEHAATFLPKWHHRRVGSSAHVHQSLWQNGDNLFFDPNRPHGKSVLFDQYLAGLLKYASQYTYFMAPYLNSYKRFTSGSFAPTRIVWAVDNRTAAFRLCGENSKAIRIECRIPGSDMNPYLVIAAMLAAGMRGITEQLCLTEPYTGNAYTDDTTAHIPHNLRDATQQLNDSKMLRDAMGDDVIDHYVRAAMWEQEEFDRVVTDWEIARGFERA